MTFIELEPNYPQGPIDYGRMAYFATNTLEGLNANRSLFTLGTKPKQLCDVAVTYHEGWGSANLDFVIAGVSHIGVRKNQNLDFNQLYFSFEARMAWHPIDHQFLNVSLDNGSALPISLPAEAERVGSVSLRNSLASMMEYTTQAMSNYEPLNTTHFSGNAYQVGKLIYMDMIPNMGLKVRFRTGRPEMVLFDGTALFAFYRFGAQEVVARFAKTPITIGELRSPSTEMLGRPAPTLPDHIP